MREVLFIIERPTPQRAPVLDALHRDGIPIRVIYLHGDPAEQGWGYLPLEHPHEFADALTSRQLRGIVRDVLRRRFSVVVSMGYRGALRESVLSAARVNRTPVVMRFDTNQRQIESGGSKRRALRRLAMRSLIPRSATAWAIGSQNERFWREEIGLTKIVSIPYEVPVLPGAVEATQVTTPRNSDPQRLRFLYVGRLAEIKRVHDAIRSFKQLPHDGWTLRIVGTGPSERELRDLSKDDSRITFVGSRTYQELGEDFRDSDVLVLPSAGEPWGLVVNEALGYGLRVIASDQVGAAYDLLDDSNGEIYPMGDVQALASALDRCQDHLTQSPRPPATSTAQLMAHDLRRLARQKP